MNKKIIVSMMVVLSLSIFGSNLVNNLDVNESNSVTPYAEFPAQWLD